MGVRGSVDLVCSQRTYVNVEKVAFSGNKGQVTYIEETQPTVRDEHTPPRSNGLDRIRTVSSKEMRWSEILKSLNINVDDW